MKQEKGKYDDENADHYLVSPDKLPESAKEIIAIALYNYYLA